VKEGSFDHLVRSQAQFDYLRGYIANNPKIAGLREGKFLHRRRADDIGEPKLR